MVYFLFDNPADKHNMDFLNQYGSTACFDLIFPQEQCKSLKSMLKICFDLIQTSKEGDTIICWYDFMGIICWWICKILHKQRNIIALNILLKDKHSVKNIVAKILYRSALKSPNLKATVTSKEYGASINKMLHIDKKYTVLHDIYHDRYDLKYEGESEKNSVFCGGRNGRDWNLIFRLANNMPDVRFNIVVPKKQMDQYKNKVGKNIYIKIEISEPDFLNLMCSSEIVLMPLNTEAPAGLIAMFQAAANGKLVITSNTVTTREYFADNRGVLCSNSFNEWEKQIRYWLKHPTEAQERANKLKAFLKNECSEQKYSVIIQKVISDNNIIDSTQPLY